MNRYNREGYFDPTAYLALSAIEREERRRRRENQTHSDTVPPFPSEFAGRWR